MVIQLKNKNIYYNQLLILLRIFLTPISMGWYLETLPN